MATRTHRCVTAFSSLTRALAGGKPQGLTAVSLLTAVFLAVHPGLLEAASIKVTWDPAKVTRGAVVLLKVESPVRLMAADASTSGERFPLIRVREDVLAALVGIDAKTEGTSVPVDFTLFPARGGPPYRIRADLVVRESGPAAGKVQKLSLPSGMVDLSQQRVRQVRRDNRTLGDILATRSRIRPWKEGFLLPLKGRITTRFGTGRILNGKPRGSHSGVDIAGRKGTPVMASNDGKVLLADDFYLSGKTVVVDHGWGVLTIYAHLDRFRVREGQDVERGQVLGTVGSTGRATGPHLHFGAFVRGIKVDPLQLIEATKQL